MFDNFGIASDNPLSSHCVYSPTLVHFCFQHSVLMALCGARLPSSYWSPLCLHEVSEHLHLPGVALNQGLVGVWKSQQPSLSFGQTLRHNSCTRSPCRIRLSPPPAAFCLKSHLCLDSSQPCLPHGLGAHPKGTPNKSLVHILILEFAPEITNLRHWSSCCS